MKVKIRPPYIAPYRGPRGRTHRKDITYHEDIVRTVSAKLQIDQSIVSSVIFTYFSVIKDTLLHKLNSNFFTVTLSLPFFFTAKIKRTFFKRDSSFYIKLKTRVKYDTTFTDSLKSSNKAILSTFPHSTSKVRDLEYIFDTEKEENIEKGQVQSQE